MRNVTAMPLLAALALLLTACGAEKPETAAYAPPEEQRRGWGRNSRGGRGE